MSTELADRRVELGTFGNKNQSFLSQQRRIISVFAGNPPSIEGPLQAIQTVLAAHSTPPSARAYQRTNEVFSDFTDALIAGNTDAISRGTTMSGLLCHFSERRLNLVSVGEPIIDMAIWDTVTSSLTRHIAPSITPSLGEDSFGRYSSIFTSVPLGTSDILIVTPRDIEAETL